MENERLLLSIREAAQRLSLSSWTLRAWIRQGKLRPVRLGSRLLIEPCELERLISAGRTAGSKEVSHAYCFKVQPDCEDPSDRPATA